MRRRAGDGRAAVRRLLRGAATMLRRGAATRRLGVAAAGLLAAALLTGCGEGAGDRSRDADMAPDYTAVTLDGDNVALADLRGEVVLLNVWATWCAPCRREIPELQALHEQHADEGLRVVGVTVDSRHMEADIRSFMDQFGMTYDIWWDPDQTIVDELDAVGVPVTVLVDREGRIAWRHLGAFERGDPALTRAVEEALGSTDGGRRRDI